MIWWHIAIHVRFLGHVRGLKAGITLSCHVLSRVQSLGLQRFQISDLQIYLCVQLDVCSRYQKRTAKAAQDSVASANEVAEETLSLLRLVRTFGTEKEEVARSLLPHFVTKSSSFSHCHVLLPRLLFLLVSALMLHSDRMILCEQQPQCYITVCELGR